VRLAEKALAGVGISERDFRCRSRVRPFDPEGLPPLHRYVDPDQERWKRSPEPPPEEEDEARANG
jgi:hypothetical protein